MDKIYLEYRTPTGISDQYLNWLKDGSPMLKRFSYEPKVNIEGILVRAASSEKDVDTTHLFDAHPLTKFKEMSIRWPHNTGRFVDAFVNTHEELTLPAPINLKIKVHEKEAYKYTTGMKIQVTRTAAKPVEEKPKPVETKPPTVKFINELSGTLAGIKPTKEIRVGFFMIKSKNPKPLTEIEK